MHVAIKLTLNLKLLKDPKFHSHKPSWCQFDFPKLLETMSLPMKLILTNQIVRLDLLEVFVDAPDPYSIFIRDITY